MSGHTEMSIERKAELFDRERDYADRLNKEPFQIFRVTENGRWVQVLARNCAPSPEGESAGSHMAIIDGVPHSVEIQSDGSSFVPFPGGDDGETQYNFKLVANGITVGECSYREY